MEKKKVERKAQRPIGEEEALRGFLALHPDFERCWREAQEDFREAASRLVYGNIAGELAEIVVRDPKTDFRPLVKYVELLMREGTNDVKSIISVFFIEDLLSVASHCPKEIAPILRQFGPLSRAFALEYNRIMRYTSEGLER